MKPTVPTLLKHGCNLSTVRDGRGAIFSFVPFEEPIAEWTFVFLNAGKARGHHCHPEFDEYLMVTSGSAVEICKVPGREESFKLEKGECLFIPSGFYHTLIAITDCEAVAFLTRRWDDCERPIIQDRLADGHGLTRIF